MAERLDKSYRWLVGETGSRVCTGISDEACADTPRNFHVLVGANTLTQIGDEVANSRTTLAWLMSAAGAPAFLFGFLVPLRESGSMLPQVLLAPWLNRFRGRRGFWIGGSVVQGLCVLAMPAALLLDSGLAAGLWVLALLALFSLGRCLCSITFKDITGKTVPKTRRGRLSGLTAGVSGLFALAVGLGLYLLEDGNHTAALITLLLAAGAGLWLLAAGLFSLVREPEGEAARVSGILRDAWRDLGLLRTNRDVRGLVLTRTFLLCPTLTAPYYTLLASQADASASLLGLFIVAHGLAAGLSAPLWGRFADHSSRRCMMVAGLLASGLGVVYFLVQGVAGEDALPPWIYPVAFFILHIGHSGIRTGRKTWVVDAAEGAQRTRYVAVSNTVIGLVLLAAGLAGLLASIYSVPMVILLLSLAGLPGVWQAWRLRETEEPGTTSD